MPRRDFTNVISIPDTGNAELNKALNAMKENLELLCGQRGDSINHAVLKGDIEVDYPDNPAVLDSLKETVRKLLVSLKAR